MQGNEALYGVLGIVLGFLTAIAIFRARFVAIEKDLEHVRTTLKEEIKRVHEDASREWGRIREEVKQMCGRDSEYQERVERRQREELILLATIARKLGAQTRMTDLGTYLEEENVHGHESKRDI